MPTTFNVISLGVLADIDPREGNYLAENASALEGMTFGAPGAGLVDDFASLSPVGNPGGEYEVDNTIANEQFSIDGGTPQTFDSTATYHATLTYSDGTTANITASIIQDTDGNAYLVPEVEFNTDQGALEAGPIQSLELGKLTDDQSAGAYSFRKEWDFVTCFVAGTEIQGENGPVLVENLQPGDLVRTLDHGLQPLRWIGSRTLTATGVFAPIKISRGALGNDAELLISPQHRMLLTGWRAEIFCGQTEVLAAAKSLINGDTIARQPGGEVTYYHIMFDQHELVFAAGIPSESFNPGEMGWGTLPEHSRQEILALFPELEKSGVQAYGPPIRPVLKPHEVQLLFR